MTSHVSSMCAWCGFPIDGNVAVSAAGQITDRTGRITSI